MLYKVHSKMSKKILPDSDLASTAEMLVPSVLYVLKTALVYIVKDTALTPKQFLGFHVFYFDRE